MSDQSSPKSAKFINTNLFAYVLGLVLGAGLVISVIVALREFRQTGPMTDPVPVLPATVTSNDLPGTANLSATSPNDFDLPASHPFNAPNEPTDIAKPVPSIPINSAPQASL